VKRSRFNTYFACRDNSVLNGGISVTLGRNISYMSGHDQFELYNGGRVHFDSVASGLTGLMCLLQYHSWCVRMWSM